MNPTPSNAAYLSRLQQLEFACQKTNGKINPSALASNLRSIYLHYMHSVESLEENNPEKHKSKKGSVLATAEASKTLKKYGDVVDNMDEGGLNNFAEGALALCQYHKNESAKWKTSLTMENIMRMPVVSKVIGQNKSESEEEDFDISFNLSSSLQPGVSKATSETKTGQDGVLQYSEDLKAPKKTQPSPLLQLRDCSSVPSHTPHVALLSERNPSQQPQQSTPGWSRQAGWQQGPPSCFKSSTNAGQRPQTQHAVKQSRSLYQQIDSDSEPDVNPSRVGGPYANYGQKRKNPANVFEKQRGRGYKSWRKGDYSEEDEDDDCDTLSSDDRGSKPGPFKTARDQLIINQQKNGGGPVSGSCYGAAKKSLGTRRGPASKFVPPVLNRDSDQLTGPSANSKAQWRGNQAENDSNQPDEPVDERLKGIDPKMIELITNEIMDTSSSLTWSDIAGLEFAKKTIQEIVVWPMLRPDIFTGLRGPPKGLLLFGPPGTGKTLIGKCIASQSKSTFFCISASSLTSKWVGEGEKMVRTLFAVARCNQPAVIFIDEIDSLLSQRSDSEHESSRRIKTEFLVQLDGATTESEDRILVIGATNRPQEIDEAARRRFVKRLLIPLPESVARRQIVFNLMSRQNSDLADADVQQICCKTEGYSGADMTNLCREAALGPIRSIPFDQMETITPDQVRPIQLPDFEQALLQVRASVSDKDLELYTQWNKTYGSFGHGH